MKLRGIHIVLLGGLYLVSKYVFLLFLIPGIMSHGNELFKSFDNEIDCLIN